MDKKVLTIIPAKLGSTRLPRKNILPLRGRPLIEYTIKSATESGCCGEIMVSTESEEIADIAKQAGAKVPFMRSKDLARDPAGVADVCLDVLRQYERIGKFFDILIILLPTTPFRTPNDIRNALDIFKKNKAKFLMSVSEFGHNPFWALKRLKQKSLIMEPCFPDFINLKRHELPNTYRANGAITIVDIPSFLENRTYYGRPLFTYTMPWNRSVDIDTLEDFLFAEFLLERGIFDEQDS
ncbi:cytidylyltransferase domain-containing protein [Desulfonauticus submarinus]|nr:acylneuraminate cytidylyltransferase family protein [Desulfonauticus submarinus]